MFDISYKALYQAWLNFRSGKKSSRAIDEFAYNIEANLLQLAKELADRTYRHGGYQRIVVEEKKRRDLAVADVRDRVVHRLLYDYLLTSFDPTFDFDVWSCRKGKGLDACLLRTQQFLAKYPNSYVWRADIVKFFDNVNHERLLKLIARKHPNDTPLLWSCYQVVASYHTNKESDVSAADRRGIPIGNLTSQIFANIFLHELDRFVRHQLKPIAYIRYGDDFVLFACTRREAYQFQAEGAHFLNVNLGLLINPKTI